MSTGQVERAGPVTARERMVSLDAIRGVALFGILIVNITYFANPVSDPFNHAIPASVPETATAWLIAFFAQGKFYPLFSLLFGLGFAMQIERASSARRAFVPVYLRRLLVLLIIGIAHGILIWAGDILTVYALLGFLLLLVGRGKPHSLLILATIAYMVQVSLVMGMAWSINTAAQCAKVENTALMTQNCDSTQMQGLLHGFEKNQTGMTELQQAARSAYSTGTFAEVSAVRVDEFGMMLSNMGFFGAQVLAMFLFGAWLGRRRYFAAPEQHKAFFRNALILAVVIGLPLSAWFATVHLRVDYTDLFDAKMAKALMINLFAGPLLSVGYASAIVLGMQTCAAAWLGLVAPVGRMALTNYLLQSVICTLIFYSYGIGLMAEQPKLLVQVGIVIAVFAVQVVWSHWWLKRFALGPVEWLWRALTYMSLPPMRRKI